MPYSIAFPNPYKPLEEIRGVFDAMKEGEWASFHEMAQALLDAKRIFCAGAGRSGLWAKALAMRLAQADFSVHCVGDATTPSIQEGDALFIISGSGKTQSMGLFAQKAKKKSAKILLLTYAQKSPIGEIADVAIALPIPLDAKRPGGLAGSQRLGSCFDQCAMIALDILADSAAGAKNISDEDMGKRHADLE
jgi:6-phospho-3-hexuloisomerase